MSFLFVYVPILVIFWDVAICEQEQLQSEIRITKAENCNITGQKWYLQNITISFLYPRSYVNAILNVTEETKKIKKVYVHLDRCNDQGFNCEDFQDWYFDNFCAMLNWKNQVWSGFTDTLRPPFRCPIKKMAYQSRNATYDFNIASRWYPEFMKYQWRTTSKFLNERDEMVFCAMFETHVYQYRKRNRKS